MKTPIEPSEIKAGDLIRKEYGVEVGHGELALEYRATSDAHGKGGPGQHYLLDRPRVILYPAGTKLWMTEDLYPFKTGEAITVKEDVYEGQTEFPTTTGRPFAMCALVSLVTDKPPFTSVPTAALDQLRAARKDTRYGSLIPRGAVSIFLAAVDKAANA